MKEALTFIVSSLVDHPEKVVVEMERVNDIDELTIYTDPEDTGKVIGKEGKVIRAIRNVMKIIAMKEDKKIFIRVKDQA